MYTQETECEECSKYTLCYYKAGRMVCEDCLDFINSSSILFK